MNILQYIGMYICMIFLALCAAFAPVSDKLKQGIWKITFILFIVIETFQIGAFVTSLIKYFMQN